MRGGIFRELHQYRANMAPRLLKAHGGRGEVLLTGAECCESPKPAGRQSGCQRG